MMTAAASRPSRHCDGGQCSRCCAPSIVDPGRVCSPILPRGAVAASSIIEDCIIEVCAASALGLVRAVDGVDLRVPRGGILGLIGRNGAGKSTLFKAMLGLTPVTSGEIRIGGQPVRGRAFREVRRSIGYLPENAVFYDNLTGLETLQFFAALKGADRHECPRLLERVGLGGGDPASGVLMGMRQRLGLAQALLSGRLLFLDEPTNGLDPDGARFTPFSANCAGRGDSAADFAHPGRNPEQVDLLAIMKLGSIQASVRCRSCARRGPAGHHPGHAHDGASERLRQALTARAGHPAGGALLAIECRRDRKMLVLETLARLDGAVADLQVREPSLEDGSWATPDERTRDRVQPDLRDRGQEFRDRIRNRWCWRWHWYSRSSPWSSPISARQSTVPWASAVSRTIASLVARSSTCCR